LQGLYDKASKINSIPVNKLATLEAVILKKPTKYKSALPAPEPIYQKNEEAGKCLQQYLPNIHSIKESYFLIEI